MLKKINISLIIVLAIPIGLLTFLSMFCYWGVEEGTSNEVTYYIGYSFNVFRFPSHNILWNFMTSDSGGRFIVTFFFGLLFNTLFYAFLIERIISLFKS
jgi:hypothetical protein